MPTPSHIVKCYRDILTREPRRETLPKEVIDALVEMCRELLGNGSTPAHVQLDAWACLVRVDLRFNAPDSAKTLLEILAKLVTETPGQEPHIQGLRESAEEIIRTYNSRRSDHGTGGSQNGGPSFLGQDTIISTPLGPLPVWSSRALLSSWGKVVPVSREDVAAAAAAAATTAGFPDLPDLQASQSTVQSNNGPKTPTQFSSQDCFDGFMEDAGEQ